MLTIIRGRAGDGKTTAVINQIGALIKQGKKSVLIVPDQVTYAAEKDICSQLQLDGFSLCSVLSFNRFCESIIRSDGKKCPQRLSDAGRLMLLERAVLCCRDQLRVFSSACRRSGFAERMERMLSLLKSCRVSPDDLEQMCAALSPSLLKEKLSDTAVIYRLYQQMTGQDYCDNNDLFAMAAECKSSPMLKNCHIFIDGFDMLTRQMLWFIQRLLLICDITVSLSIDDNAPWLYSAQRRALDWLLQAAAACNSPLRTIELANRRRGNGFDALHDMYALAKSTNDGSGGIDLFIAPDTEAEIRHAAYQIRLRLRAGARYRDFAVACCDASLLSSIERIFADYSLPVFCDTARPMQAQPAVQLLLSALDACRADNSSKEILDFLSNCLCPVETEDSEHLREIIVSLGLTNYELLVQCGRVSEKKRIEIAELSHALEPLRALRARLADCRSARCFASNVWEFIQQINLPEHLDRLIVRCIEMKLFAEADEYKQVWDNMIEQLEQLNMLMENAPAPEGADIFISMLRRGFEGQSCFVLPSTVDCITVGDPARSRFSGVTELYVLGAADGFFPILDSGEGLLSPPELQRVNSSEKVLSPDTEDSSVKHAFELFSMMLKPELLHISYALKKGRSVQRAGSLLERIRACTPLEDSAFDLDEERLACPMGALEIIAADNGVHNKKHAAVFEALKLLNAGALKAALAPREDYPSNAAQLYGDVPISMSRLETQAECPLKNLLTGGMRLSQSVNFQSNSIDIGNIMHSALEKTVPELMNMSEPNLYTEQIVEKNLYAAALNTHDGVMLHTARARLLCARLNKSIAAACRGIMQDIDIFRPMAFEVSFGRGQYPAIELDTVAGRVRLQGKIDRVDISRDGTALRIVDYKSSRHTITPQSVQRGTTLQLPLYMMAMEKATGASGVAMYYQDCFAHELNYSGLCCLHELTADKKSLSSEEFRSVLSDARDAAARLAVDMLAGNIETCSPEMRKSSTSPCSFCPHISVCTARINTHKEGDD